MLRLLAPLTVLSALVLPAAGAQAATFSGVDGRLHVTAAPGEQNAISIRPLDTGPVIVRDDGPNASPSGCPEYQHPENDVPGDLICSAVRAPVITLGDEDDSVSVSDAGTEDLIGVTEVDAGPGDDSVGTGSSDDVILGGDGDDVLTAGELGADRLEGGEGDDELQGRWGADTLIGGPGADHLDGGDQDDVLDAVDGERDTVLCGDGVDTATADAVDEVAGCENVTRVGGGNGGGGGGSSSSGSSGDTAPPAAAPPAPPVAVVAPAPVASVRAADAPDVRAPGLKLRLRGRLLTVTCDEACTVKVRSGGRTLTRRLAAGRAKRIRLTGRGRRARIVARDAAGNARAATRRIRVF